MEEFNAKKIINWFIFKNKRDTHMDIFSQPLIYVGHEEVVFCPALINQINIPRYLENLSLDNGVKISLIGKKFEEELRILLAKSENIKVNTSRLDFIGLQGEVEYDFLATFDDYLIIMEFKALVTPYDEVRLKKDEKEIKKGINQVNKRCKTILTDWNKVKANVNIDLPDKPFEEDKIIKIVCTNIYDFTTLEYDNVLITDSSVISKFFNNPIITRKQNNKVVSKHKMWKGDMPTVNEFLEYLKNPHVIKLYDNNIDVQGRVFNEFKDEYIVGVYDFYLKDDPIKNFDFN